MSTEIKITPEQAAAKLHDFFAANAGGSPLPRLLERGELLQQARSIGDADVYRLTLDGCTYLIKTYINRPKFIRWLIGRRCLRNEFHKLSLVQALGVVRAPKPYALLEKDTLAIEFLHDTIPLKTPESMVPDRYPDHDFFHELAAMVRSLHAAGISHGDLRRANILVGKDGRPYLIDFATTVQCSPAAAPWCRAMARLFINSDNFSLAKITESFYPGLLDDDALHCFYNPPWYLRLGRFLRRNIYRRYIRTSK